MIAKTGLVVHTKQREYRPVATLCACFALLGGSAYAAAADAATGVASPSAEVSEETVQIPGPLKGMKLGLRHAWSPAAAATREPRFVVILPGAAVPISGNQDYKFVAGRSMMTAIAQSGVEVWGMDYYGFGASDRYPQMQEPADKHAALGNAQDCADQVESVFAYLAQKRHAGQVMLLGDSGGTLVAGVFATRHPELVGRLILFGPVTPFSSGAAATQLIPAYDLITPQDLWAQFTSWSAAAGTPAVLDPGAYDAWAADYLGSDPTSRTRTPPSVRVPDGRQADLAGVASGKFTYDPGAIKAPTLIVMGEFDEIATFPGAQWLLHSLHQAPSRRLLVIGHGSHTIQFEIERAQLYRAMTDFLNEQN